MKWEIQKTEVLEFEVDNLPDEAYAELVPHVCEGIRPSINSEGEIYFFHEWDSDKQYSRSWDLAYLVLEFAHHDTEDDAQKAALLKELEKAADILRRSLTHNAEVTGSEAVRVD